LIRVVSVTKKGQATIPKDLRDKFGMKDRIIVVETEEGILFKPLPTPEEEFGSLKDLFAGKASREILEEARAEDLAKEKGLLERLRK